MPSNANKINALVAQQIGLQNQINQAQQENRGRLNETLRKLFGGWQAAMMAQSFTPAIKIEFTSKYMQDKQKAEDDAAIVFAQSMGPLQSELARVNALLAGLHAHRDRRMELRTWDTENRIKRLEADLNELHLIRLRRSVEGRRNPYIARRINLLENAIRNLKLSQTKQQEDQQAAVMPVAAPAQKPAAEAVDQLFQSH